MCHLFVVRSHMTGVMRHMSGVTFHLSRIWCHMSQVNYQKRHRQSHPPTPNQVSFIASEVSCLTCQVSSVKCQLSTVRFQMSDMMCQVHMSDARGPIYPLNFQKTQQQEPLLPPSQVSC